MNKPRYRAVTFTDLPVVHYRPVLWRTIEHPEGSGHMVWMSPEFRANGSLHGVTVVTTQDGKKTSEERYAPSTVVTLHQLFEGLIEQGVIDESNYKDYQPRE